MKTITYILMALTGCVLGLHAQAVKISSEEATPPTSQKEPAPDPAQQVLDKVYAELNKAEQDTKPEDKPPVQPATPPAAPELPQTKPAAATNASGAQPAPASPPNSSVPSAATTNGAPESPVPPTARPIPGRAIRSAVTPLGATATNTAPAVPGRPLPGALPGRPGPAAAAGGVQPVPGSPVPGVPGVPGVPAAGGGAAALPGIPGGAPGGGSALGVPPPAAGSTNGVANPDDELFPPGMIKFQDTDLSQVLDIYQDLTGRTILRPANLPQVKITIKSQTELTRKEAVQALDSILSLNAITMVPQGDKFIKAVPQAQAGTEAREANTDPYGALPESGSYVVQIVKLKNTAPRDVAQALQPFAKMPNAILAIDQSGILILRDNAENVKRMMEVLEQIDIIPVREYESVVIPIKYALASDIAQVLSSLTEGGTTTTVGSQGAQGGLGGGLGGGIGARGTGSLGGGGYGGYGGYGGSGYGGGYGGGYNQGYRLRASLGTPTTPTQTTGSRTAFQDRLRNIVRAAGGAGEGGPGEITVLGETKIIADERTNSLLIFATKSDIQTIKEIIEKLDVILPQVLIEAIIMEVSLDDNFNLGVSWIQRPQTVGKFTGTGASLPGRSDGSSTESPFSPTNLLNLVSGFSYFGNYNDDLDVALVAAAGDSRVNLLSRPRIQTSHAVEANLFVGERRPFVTGTYFGGSGFGSTSQYQYTEIGITLSVLPLINTDGLVVMDIRQQIEGVSGSATIDGNEVPITSSKEANAKVAVRDRQTIMLGGFISNDQRKSKSGVPFLKDIPLLGALFRSRSSTDARRELIVLIRPTVLPTPGDAEDIAKQERSNLPGILQAERDIKQSEKSRMDKVKNESLKKEGFKY